MSANFLMSDGLEFHINIYLRIFAWRIWLVITSSRALSNSSVAVQSYRSPCLYIILLYYILALLLLHITIRMISLSGHSPQKNTEAALNIFKELWHCRSSCVISSFHELSVWFLLSTEVRDALFCRVRIVQCSAVHCP